MRVPAKQAERNAPLLAKLAKSNKPLLLTPFPTLSGHSALKRYGLALGSVVVALAATLLARSFAPRVTFLLFIAALLFSAGYGGFGPGLLCLTVIVVICDYFLFDPLYTLHVTTSDFYALVLFFCVGLAVIGVMETMRAAHRRAAAAYERVEEESRRYALLCSLSKTLLSAKEAQPALNEVAKAITADFADWCLIDARDAQGRLHNTACAHRDAAQAAKAEQWESFYPRAAADTGLSAQTTRSGHLQAAYHVTEAFLQSAAPDTAEFGLLHSLNIASYLCLPLLAQGRALGAITLLSCRADRQFRLADLDTALEIASRIALTLDNKTDFLP